jgi:hypothetical protein
MMHGTRPKASRALARRGFTFFEFLVAGLIIVVVGGGIGMILQAHWNAYRDTLYQNRVNLEARRALDAICDQIRAGGASNDAIDNRNTFPAITTGSNVNQLELLRTLDDEPIEIRTQTIGGSPYLIFNYGAPGTLSDAFKIAQYITSLRFEYEYRAWSQDSGWTFVRTTVPDGYYSRISTIYVTVTATIPSSITGGPAYTRTLTSAAHLRGPYNPLGT